jgi:ribosomal protein S18 acetylase RimI-like enzyme
MDFLIEKASLEDTQTLRSIAKETFFETFAKSNTEDNMKRYLEENFSIPKIQAQLEDPGSLFFIALDRATTAGYLKLNTGESQTEPKLYRENTLEIERIYVRSAYLGKKAGQQLLEKALEIAKAQKREFIWLAVWENNPRAIRFYEKNGFIAFGQHAFIMGDEAQTDIMMRKEL